MVVAGIVLPNGAQASFFLWSTPELILCVPDDWESRWVASEHAKDLGKFVLSAGKYFSDKEKDKGEVCFIVPIFY